MRCPNSNNTLCGKLVVKSDHNSLKYLLGQHNLNDRQHRWVNKLQSYDFEIEYVKSKNNISADALSCTPFHSMPIITADWKVTIMAEYVKNNFTCNLFDGRTKDDRFRIK